MRLIASIAIIFLSVFNSTYAYDKHFEQQHHKVSTYNPSNKKHTTDCGNGWCY